jgi:aspartyl-tRNA(Asn)/glutamyl-tRNA(Gln) amidotransferase subunit A
MIQQRRVSPVVVVAQCLERIERLQPELNAFITLTPEAAMEQAKAAEAEIRNGGWKGALHGIPVAVKDFYDTAGIKTTAAFEYFKMRVPAKDAASVEKLKKAGAIIVGKTNMHALGMGTTGLESCFGPVRNPWSQDHIPGGSSSGSAAAVASGMCYATLDTDAIGSCRLPAACCGVVGFKGTYGLIDMKGILDGERPPEEDILWMAHAGITTRYVQDTALVLQVLVGQHLRTGKPQYYGDLTRQRKLRVGVAGNCKCDTTAAEVFERAIETICDLGYSIKRTSAPLFDFSKGIASIESDRKAIAEQAFRAADVLLLPTIPTSVPLVSAAKHPQALSSAYTSFANYYSLPAINIPCGLSGDGLPIGLQIVGKPWDDSAVLRIAYQYQSQIARGEPRKHPLP